ncbi:hypothetical protein CMQ_5189 [Grosmannia clavigera kw1407]|uniref:Transcription elongation factor Eaf N-terminal domain-containing protein n=1 Tax=Grosmannia clavigera (strain kw1407 / UAMH 11150) TaxID=655863 RepID=F0XB28_GROCL|nr:uncharacterized protein CMQ_5189 [Grosmannia clavigera kw1407]EFX04927.1 hypothetical protein CMQ_5189 [Grosmannia clavigera kw1407]
MATSSMALSRAGLIDPTKPATYPVILGEDIRSSGSPSQQLFTGIRYNFKAKQLTDKSTQHTSTLTSRNNDDDARYEITFRDNSGGRYVYAGQRVSKNSKYVLVFDHKRRVFILHRLDSLFVMNMTDTPTNHDSEALKKKYPHIGENTTRRLRQHRGSGAGSSQAVRRPLIKKSGSGGGGALRPMQKPVSRPPPRPASVLRNSHDVVKKNTASSTSSSGSSSKSRSSLLEPPDLSRETKASKDVRLKREDMVAKEAQDNRDARDKAARDAALRKTKAAALAARPREGSKLSQETRASPDVKPRDGRGELKESAAKPIDIRTKDSNKTSIDRSKKPLSSKPKNTTGRDKDGEAGKSVSSTPSSKAAARSQELPRPTPEATSRTKSAPKKKKQGRPSHGARGGHAFSAGRGAGGVGGGTSQAAAKGVQLHMPTFSEFQQENADDNGMEEVGPDEDLDGFWDPREEAAGGAEASGGGGDGGIGNTLGVPAATPSPAATPEPEPMLSVPRPSSSQRERQARVSNTPLSNGNRPKVAAADDDVDELEEALLEELREAEEAEKKKREESERKKREEAALEAQLEAELMAESESEISEEE